MNNIYATFENQMFRDTIWTIIALYFPFSGFVPDFVCDIHDFTRSQIKIYEDFSAKYLPFNLSSFNVEEEESWIMAQFGNV